MQAGEKSAIVGSIVHSIAFGSVEIIENGAIIYDSVTGSIEKLTSLDSDPSALSDIAHCLDFSGKLIVPGFVDAHCHAPQYVFTGTGMDLSLLDWLNKYTFPAGKC